MINITKKSFSEFPIDIKWSKGAKSPRQINILKMKEGSTTFNIVLIQHVMHTSDTLK